MQVLLPTAHSQHQASSHQSRRMLGTLCAEHEHPSSAPHPHSTHPVKRTWPHGGPMAPLLLLVLVPGQQLLLQLLRGRLAHACQQRGPRRLLCPASLPCKHCGGPCRRARDRARARATECRGAGGIVASAMMRPPAGVQLAWRTCSRPHGRPVVKQSGRPSCRSSCSGSRGLPGVERMPSLHPVRMPPLTHMGGK